MMSDRERFLSLLFTAPLLAADAIVVLAGEDADARAAFAAQLYRMRPTPIYVTGGRSEPPRHTKAEAVAGKLMGHGVAPSAIIVDNLPLNTWEQAESVAIMVKAREWRRVLLVASAYHLPRGYLSTLRALQNAGLDETLHVVPVAASAPWSDSPPGVTETRDRLLSCEASKIDHYAGRGHVASYSEGIASLLKWEKP